MNFGFGLAGIIGMPVAHSRSPAIHNFWLNAHGIRGAYLPLAVEPGRLKEALPGLVALGFRGCNVTMPHKQSAMALLHRVNDTARRIGCSHVETNIARARCLFTCEHNIAVAAVMLRLGKTGKPCDVDAAGTVRNG